MMNFRKFICGGHFKVFAKIFVSNIPWRAPVISLRLTDWKARVRRIFDGFFHIKTKYQTPISLQGVRFFSVRCVFGSKSVPAQKPLP